jgi:DNA-binding NarL/FixJ family response regulator
MDMIMPGLNGFEATWAIRQIPDLQDVIIAGVSASAFDSDQQQALQAGCNAFLPKPVEIPTLLNLLEETLDLEWVYEETATDSAETPQSSETIVIPPPIEELNRLYHLAMSGDVDEIQSRAEHLERKDQRYVPFARKLRTFARNFQDDQLLAFVEQYKRTHE